MQLSEHILLESADGADDSAAAGRRSPQQHFHILNRARALSTEMILFEGGWLSIREHRNNKPGEAHMINLRFVDPQPDVERYFARSALIWSAGFGVAGLAAATATLMNVAPTAMLIAAIGSFCAAIIAFAICAYKTHKLIVFRTLHGRAPVMRLMATLGSFRTLRQTLPKIVAAIEEAVGSAQTQPDNAPPQENDALRSEMRETYRLRECGVLDEEQCAGSTQRILQRFR